MNFANRTVIVTGAAGNLGKAVATAFAEQGANLVLVDLAQLVLLALPEHQELLVRLEKILYYAQSLHFQIAITYPQVDRVIHK